MDWVSGNKIWALYPSDLQQPPPESTNLLEDTPWKIRGVAYG